jgi:hypothetical protein
MEEKTIYTMTDSEWLASEKSDHYMFLTDTEIADKIDDFTAEPLRIRAWKNVGDFHRCVAYSLVESTLTQLWRAARIRGLIEDGILRTATRKIPAQTTAEQIKIIAWNRHLDD